MQHLSLRPLALSTLVGGLALAAPAWSQYTGAWGTTWNNPNSALISHFIQHNMQASQLRTSLTNQMIGQDAISRSSRKASGRTAPAKPAARKPPATGLPKRTTQAAPTPAKPTAPITANASPTNQAATFKAVSGRVLPARFAQKSAKSPDEQKQLEAVLHKVINDWETQALNRQGLGRFNELWDLSKSLPYSIAVMHGVYRGNGAPPSREMILATQRTLGDQLRRSPQVASMSDLQKQELYETQAVMTYMLESGREAAARTRNLDAERKIQEMAGRFLTSILGEDPDKILISNDGFELRK